MGLRDKAEVYLSERRETMLAELAARDYHEPFSYDEWLITALLRDLAGRKNAYERTLAAYRDLSLAFTKDHISSKDAERALLAFVRSALNVPYAICYRSKKNELAADDVSRAQAKEQAIPAALPVALLSAAIGGTCVPVRSLTADKRIADSLSEDDRKTIDDSYATPVTGISPAGMLLTGPKPEKEQYTDEDCVRLAYAARIIAFFDEGSGVAEDRGRHDDAFEAVLLAGHAGKDALTKATVQALRSIGITQSVYLVRSSTGKLSPASKGDFPKGFQLKAFKDFRTVDPSHTAILPFTYGEKPAKKGGASAVPGKVFWFVPISRKNRLVAAILVFSFKGISDTLPASVSKSLLRLQRYLSAAVVPAKRSSRKKSSVPKEKKERPARPAKPEKARILPSDRISPAQ
ncbi:MAG: hypothetical protein AABZ39_07525 [Spirochaetota bacterium]